MNYRKLYLDLADIILADSIDRTPLNVKTLAYKAREALNQKENAPAFDMETEIIAMNRYYNKGVTND